MTRRALIALLQVQFDPVGDGWEHFAMTANRFVSKLQRGVVDREYWRDHVRPAFRKIDRTVMGE